MSAKQSFGSFLNILAGGEWRSHAVPTVSSYTGQGRRARRTSKKKQFGIMRSRENTNPFTGNHPLTRAFLPRLLSFIHSLLRRRDRARGPSNSRRNRGNSSGRLGSREGKRSDSTERNDRDESILAANRKSARVDGRPFKCRVLIPPVSLERLVSPLPPAAPDGEPFAIDRRDFHEKSSCG